MNSRYLLIGASAAITLVSIAVVSGESTINNNVLNEDLNVIEDISGELARPRVGQSSTPQGYLDQILSLVGLDASRIAKWLALLGDPAYRFLNVRDPSCRVRLACDVGGAIYSRVNYLQNLAIRGTVRFWLGGQSPYARPWSEGMTGQNCSLNYPECSSWQLEAMGDMLFPPPASLYQRSPTT